MSAWEENYRVKPLTAPYGAFEPVIDRLTLETHHLGIYGGVAKSLYREERLRPFLLAEEEMPFSFAAPRNENGRIYDCHRFYFNGIAPPAPSGLRMPKGDLLLALQRDYGGVEGFFSAIKNAVLQINRVGFLWVIKGRRGIHLRFLENHQPPPPSEHPILCIDLWEHAYFLRYRERRDAYVYGFFRIINWVEIEKRYQKTKR